MHSTFTLTLTPHTHMYSNSNSSLKSYVHTPYAPQDNPLGDSRCNIKLKCNGPPLREQKKEILPPPFLGCLWWICPTNSMGLPRFPATMRTFMSCSVFSFLIRTAHKRTYIKIDADTQTCLICNHPRCTPLPPCTHFPSRSEVALHLLCATPIPLLSSLLLWSPLLVRLLTAPSITEARYEAAKTARMTQYAITNARSLPASCRPSPPLIMPRMMRMRPNQTWALLIAPRRWCCT